MQESLASLNAEAVAHMQDSRHLDAIVTYGKLNRKLLKNNLTHAQLYTCYNNQAGAYLHLHLYEEALQYAEAARRLAEAALKRYSLGPVYRKAVIGFYNDANQINCSST